MITKLLYSSPDWVWCAGGSCMGQECYRDVNATGTIAFLQKWHKEPQLIVQHHSCRVAFERWWATALAVSCLLITSTAHVWPQVRSWGICGKHSDTGFDYFPSTLVPAANFHSTSCSTVIHQPGLVQQAHQWPAYQLGWVSPHNATSTGTTSLSPKPLSIHRTTLLLVHAMRHAVA
jgi:hypothetical protein